MFAIEPVTVAAIGITVVVVLVGVTFAAMAVRAPGRGEGSVDREALKRDAARRKLEASRREAVDRGADVEVAETGLVPIADVEVAETGLVPTKEEETAVAVAKPVELDIYAPEITDVPDPVDVGITRRQTLNRGMLTGGLLSLAALGGGVLAFLWPPPTRGFGAEITVGASIDEIKLEAAANGFFYVPEGKFYLVNYVPQDPAVARAVYAPLWQGISETGLQALFQKCPHLGCRVPFCSSSEWFECPCHGSQYNSAGEKRGGPAPRGMDRFPLSRGGSRVTVDTGTVVPGPSIGTDTISQPPQGPNCV